MSSYLPQSCRIEATRYIHRMDSKILNCYRNIFQTQERYTYLLRQNSFKSLPYMAIINLCSTFKRITQMFTFGSYRNKIMDNCKG
jgi:hypothetical protein